MLYTGSTANDLNSVMNLENRKVKKALANSPVLDLEPGEEKNRIGHWDPYELAAKIKEQINIDQLI